MEGAAALPGGHDRQEKRNGESQRYRERMKRREVPRQESVIGPARVICTGRFFR
jgi:hypothetical protein